MRNRARAGVAAVVWALAMVVVAIGPGVGPAHASPMTPSSVGQVILTPSTGPVGMQMDVFISLSINPPMPYVLRVLPMSGPTTCDAARPITGAPVITVGDQGGHAQFNLPGDLGPGEYDVCATPQNASGQIARSTTTLTLYDASAPPTPVPSTGEVTLQLPPSRTVEVGGTFGLTVRDWFSPGGTDPQRVTLQLGTTSETTTYEMPFNITKDSPGVYEITVHVRDTVFPDTNWFVSVGDAYGMLSTGPLQIVLAAATPPPVPLGTQQHTVSPGVQSGSLPYVAIELVVGGILAAVVITLVVQVLRQRTRV